MDPAVAKTAPIVPILLDRERHLMYDLNAIAVIEEISGFNLLDGKQDKVFNARYLRLLVWAGLLHEDPKVKFDDFGKIATPPELSLVDVGKLLNIHNAADVLLKVGEAWKLSQPENTPGDPTSPGPATTLQ